MTYRRRNAVAKFLAMLFMIGFVATLPQDSASAAERSVPIIYSTDLYHPPADPDDQFDTATCFALKEFDIRGIILDNGHGKQIEPTEKAKFGQRIGRPPLEQLMHITGRRVKFAPGLPQPLSNLTDKGLEQPKNYQGAVELILSILRESNEKVILFNTGSCRDFAAAFNREPELFKQKVKAIYCNAGTVIDIGDVSQVDYNVALDPWAFFRMFETGVPLYWCSTRPKMSERAPGGLYSTSYWIHQQNIIRAGSLPVQNYFIYTLTHSKADPIEFLKSGFQMIPPTRGIAGDGGRFMWCTAPFCHAAGRKIYRKGIATFVALHPEDAEKAGLADHEIKLFDFVPITATPKDVPPNELPKLMTLDFKTPVENPTLFSFHRPVSDADYQTVMQSVLTNLVGELDRAKEKMEKK